MRICQVVPYDLAEQGGVKRHALQLASELRALGDDVTVMGASSEPSTDPSLRVFGGIVNIPSNGSDNRLAILAPPWRIRDWLHESAFDVVHIHEPLCPLIGPWATIFAGQSARVATFHAYAEKEAVVPRLMRWWTAPLVLRHFDRAIAVSEPAARYARYVWKDDLAIIPNGIPLDPHVPPARAPTGSKGVTRLLFVGHWRDARKGLGVLLEAFGLLRARGVAVTLDVVGSGPANSTPPDIEGVSFRGPAASEREVAERLEACDLFVAPALGQESFGIVLLEAMVAGRPIVCSDIDGFRQVVSESNARLVKPGSAEDLATAIAELAADNDARKRMAAANVVDVQKFAWSSLVHRIRDQYEAAIEQRARASS